MAQVNLYDYLDQVRELLDDEHYTQAALHCHHILRQYPRHLETYRLLGQALLEQGSHDEASDLFLRILSMDPEDFVAHVGLSQIAKSATEYTRAIWHIERACDANPNQDVIEQERTDLYQLANLGVEPSSGLTRVAVARIYLRSGMYQQAIDDLDELLRDEPTRLDARLLLAEAFWMADKNQDANSMASAVLDELPDSYKAHAILADFWLQKDEWERARPHLDKVREIVLADEKHVDLENLGGLVLSRAGQSYVSDEILVDQAEVAADDVSLIGGSSSWRGQTGLLRAEDLSLDDDLGGGTDEFEWLTLGSDDANEDVSFFTDALADDSDVDISLEDEDDAIMAFLQFDEDDTDDSPLVEDVSAFDESLAESDFDAALIEQDQDATDSDSFTSWLRSDDDVVAEDTLKVSEPEESDEVDFLDTLFAEDDVEPEDDTPQWLSETGDADSSLSLDSQEDELGRKPTWLLETEDEGATGGEANIYEALMGSDDPDDVTPISDSDQSLDWLSDLQSDEDASGAFFNQESNEDISWDDALSQFEDSGGDEETVQQDPPSSDGDVPDWLAATPDTDQDESTPDWAQEFFAESEEEPADDDGNITDWIVGLEANPTEEMIASQLGSSEPDTDESDFEDLATLFEEDAKPTDDEDASLFEFEESASDSLSLADDVEPADGGDLEWLLGDSIDEGSSDVSDQSDDSGLDWLLGDDDLQGEPELVDAPAEESSGFTGFLKEAGLADSGAEAVDDLGESGADLEESSGFTGWLDDGALEDSDIDFADGRAETDDDGDAEALSGFTAWLGDQAVEAAETAETGPSDLDGESSGFTGWLDLDESDSAELTSEPEDSGDDSSGTGFTGLLAELDEPVDTDDEEPVSTTSEASIPENDLTGFTAWLDADIVDPVSEPEVTEFVEEADDSLAFLMSEEASLDDTLVDDDGAETDLGDWLTGLDTDDDEADTQSDELSDELIDEADSEMDLGDWLADLETDVDAETDTQLDDSPSGADWLLSVAEQPEEEPSDDVDDELIVATDDSSALSMTEFLNSMSADDDVPEESFGEAALPWLADDTTLDTAVPDALDSGDSDLFDTLFEDSSDEDVELTALPTVGVDENDLSISSFEDFEIVDDDDGDELSVSALDSLDDFGIATDADDELDADWLSAIDGEDQEQDMLADFELEESDESALDEMLGLDSSDSEADLDDNTDIDDSIDEGAGIGLTDWLTDLSEQGIDDNLAEVSMEDDDAPFNEAKTPTWLLGSPDEEPDAILGEDVVGSDWLSLMATEQTGDEELADDDDPVEPTLDVDELSLIQADIETDDVSESIVSEDDDAIDENAMQEPVATAGTAEKPDLPAWLLEDTQEIDLDQIKIAASSVPADAEKTDEMPDAEKFDEFDSWAMLQSVIDDDPEVSDDLASDEIPVDWMTSLDEESKDDDAVEASDLLLQNTDDKEPPMSDLEDTLAFLEQLARKDLDDDRVKKNDKSAEETPVEAKKPAETGSDSSDELSWLDAVSDQDDEISEEPPTLNWNDADEPISVVEAPAEQSDDELGWLDEWADKPIDETTLFAQPVPGSDADLDSLASALDALGDDLPTDDDDINDNLGKDLLADNDAPASLSDESLLDDLSSLDDLDDLSDFGAGDGFDVPDDPDELMSWLGSDGDQADPVDDDLLISQDEMINLLDEVDEDPIDLGILDDDTADLFAELDDLVLDDEPAEISLDVEVEPEPEPIPEPTPAPPAKKKKSGGMFGGDDEDLNVSDEEIAHAAEHGMELEGFDIPDDPEALMAWLEMDGGFDLGGDVAETAVEETVEAVEMAQDLEILAEPEELIVEVEPEPEPEPVKKKKSGGMFGGDDEDLNVSDEEIAHAAEHGMELEGFDIPDDPEALMAWLEMDGGFDLGGDIAETAVEETVEAVEMAQDVEVLAEPEELIVEVEPEPEPEPAPEPVKKKKSGGMFGGDDEDLNVSDEEIAHAAEHGMELEGFDIPDDPEALMAWLEMDGGFDLGAGADDSAPEPEPEPVLGDSESVDDALAALESLALDSLTDAELGLKDEDDSLGWLDNVAEDRPEVNLLEDLPPEDPDAAVAWIEDQAEDVVAAVDLDEPAPTLDALGFVDEPVAATADESDGADLDALFGDLGDDDINSLDWLNDVTFDSDPLLLGEVPSEPSLSFEQAQGLPDLMELPDDPDAAFAMFEDLAGEVELPAVEQNEEPAGSSEADELALAALEEIGDDFDAGFLGGGDDLQGGFGSLDGELTDSLPDWLSFDAEASSSGGGLDWLDPSSDSNDLDWLSAVEEATRNTPDTSNRFLNVYENDDFLNDRSGGRSAPDANTRNEPVIEETPLEEEDDFVPVDPAVYEKARAALGQDDINEALTEYKTLLESKQNLRALVYELESVTMSNNHPLLQRLLGDAYMGNGQLQKALNVYRRAQELL